VLIAGAANILVGAIKLAAGIMVGSSAMLAEAAHSAADTLNQAFLLTSVHRGERPADQRHPFGYGQERYFWSLLAAFGIFVAGAGFSIFEGVLALGHGHSDNPLLAYVVLGVSGLAEGTSLVRVLVQLRGEARRGHVEMLDHVRASPDTTVKATLFEDSAAMAGLGLAALGLAGPAAGHRITGLGRRGLHRHRRIACGGGGQARPGQQRLPHRPRRRPERAEADPG